MKNDITEEQSNAILQALDKALSTGPWEETNFLRVIGKNLQKIRDDFANELHLDRDARKKAESNVANRVALRSDQQEIYISLYSSDGEFLPSWDRIVANLPRQVISRPVYADEADVKNLIRSKDNKQNEAYVAIYVNQSDILQLSEDRTSKDRFGKPLLNLKDKAINVGNISRFVHVSGIYSFLNSHLIKKPSTDF